MQRANAGGFLCRIRSGFNAVVAYLYPQTRFEHRNSSGYRDGDPDGVTGTQRSRGEAGVDSDQTRKSKINVQTEAPLAHMQFSRPPTDENFPGKA